jgi:single-strand DNA-binding protein
VNETMTTIVGNVITGITQRKIGDGTRVASFRMASNERRFDKETQQWVNGDSLYVTVTCWRKLALGVNASLVKGDPVIVTGRLFTRGYEVEGQKRSVTELEAMAVGPDLSRCLADVSRARRQASEDAPAEVSGVAGDDGEPEAPGTAIPGQQTTEPPVEADDSRSRLVAVGVG